MVTFQFLMVVAEGEVFQVYAQDRIQLLHPRTRLVLRMRFYKGFSHFFPHEKSARLGPYSGSELSADFSPSTPAAHGDFWVDEAPAAHLADIVLESNMWRDEAGFVWIRMSANPSRWHLLQKSAVHWDDPGMRLLLPGCWEVPSCSEANRAAAGFQVVSCLSLCNDRSWVACS